MTGSRVALVTGASRGLGREIARQLATKGWHVWVAARRLTDANAAAEEIGQNARPVQLDVTEQGSVDKAFSAAGRSGGLHCLINNAGIDYDTDQRAGTADLNRVRFTFETNLFGAWACAMAAIPYLTKQAHSTIVNVSSGAGALTDMASGPPGYSTSKAALNALTRILAAELRADGVLVNAVCPGWVATDMGKGGRPIGEGAKGIVWAAELAPRGPTSGFFRDGRPISW